MSAEQVLDDWFSGPKEKTTKIDPRDLLKGLKPVSLKGRVDFNIGIQLGNLTGKKFELKYQSWGFYPSRELEELLTMAQVFFIKKIMTKIEQEKPILPKIVMPEAVKQKGIVRERAYQEFLNKKNR